MLAARMLKDNWQLCVEFCELQIHLSMYLTPAALVDLNLIADIPQQPDFRHLQCAVYLLSLH